PLRRARQDRCGGKTSDTRNRRSRLAGPGLPSADRGQAGGGIGSLLCAGRSFRTWLGTGQPANVLTILHPPTASGAGEGWWTRQDSNLHLRARWRSTPPCSLHYRPILDKESEQCGAYAERSGSTVY